MLYYHGTADKFANFDLKYAKHYKDFGVGIYLATNKGHAKSVTQSRIGSYKCVRIYEVDYTDMCSRFNVRRFKGASISWVKYIILNRTKLLKDDADIVIGPTADGKVQILIQEFINSVESPTDNDYNNLIKRLKPHTFTDQVCLKSKGAVDYFNNRLKSIERI